MSLNAKTRIPELRDPFSLHRRMGRRAYWALRGVLGRLVTAFASHRARSDAATPASAPLLGHDAHLEGPVRGRALVAYMTGPFRTLSPGGSDWANVVMSRLIVASLNRLGYIVDVVDWSDLSFSPESPYDVFVGMGRNYRRICECLPPDTKCVFWATRSYWMHEREAEMKRLDALESRRGVRLPGLTLTRATDERPDPTRTHTVVLVGNQVTAATYLPYFQRVRTIDNVALDGLGTSVIHRDYAEARQHFLCMVSDGLVLKGLDLVIEAFASRRDAHLWICGPLRSDLLFRQVYRKELFRTPNIHPVGWVGLRSPVFQELARRCGAFVFASCSEGMSGAVLNCMKVGLVPIVSRNCGVDVDPFGYLLDPCTIEVLQERLACMLLLSRDEFLRRSVAARHEASCRYTSTAFEGRLRLIFEDILGGSTGDP